MVAISLRSSELLLHAVSFVGIIAALPNYEFIVGESFSKYSTSFPRRPILIPDGTTHAGRFVTAIPEVVRVVPLKRYGPERILFQSEESPDFSNDALRPMLFHKNQEKSMKGSYGIKRVRTVQPTITFSNLEWNKERLQEWRQRRTRVTSGNYGLPEDSISPLHQENDLKQFRQKLFNIKHDQQEINNTKFTMTTRNLPSTTSASSGSKPAQEVTVEDHHITKTITRKVTSVPQFRNIFRIFGLPDRSTDRATTIRSRVNVNEDRTKPRKNPSQTARIFGSAVSAGPVRALTASFFDDERSQKRYEVEENIVGEDGKRRITLQGERLIADEVDIDSLNDVTVTTDDSAPDDYADFDKQVPSNGWPEHM